MAGCLIHLLVVAIIVIIVLYIAQKAIDAIYALPPPVWLLVRLLCVLLVLLHFLPCLSAALGGI